MLGWPDGSVVTRPLAKRPFTTRPARWCSAWGQSGRTPAADMGKKKPEGKKKLTFSTDKGRAQAADAARAAKGAAQPATGGRSAARGRVPARPLMGSVTLCAGRGERDSELEDPVADLGTAGDAKKPASGLPVRTAYSASITAAPSSVRLQAAKEIKQRMCLRSVVNGYRIAFGHSNNPEDHGIRQALTDPRMVPALQTECTQWVRQGFSQTKARDKITVEQFVEYWDTQAHKKVRPGQLQVADFVDRCLRAPESLQEADAFLKRREQVYVPPASEQRAPPHIAGEHALRARCTKRMRCCGGDGACAESDNSNGRLPGSWTSLPNAEGRRFSRCTCPNCRAWACKWSRRKS